jgi:hypothetical protein
MPTGGVHEPAWQLSADSMQYWPAGQGLPPETHWPCWQVSVPVQNRPSLQSALLVQPPAQVSVCSLHAWPAPHGGVPAAQAPACQISAPLQKTPSAQSAALLQPDGPMVNVNSSGTPAVPPPPGALCGVALTR